MGERVDKVALVAVPVGGVAATAGLGGWIGEAVAEPWLRYPVIIGLAVAAGCLLGRITAVFWMRQWWREYGWRYK